MKTQALRRGLQVLTLLLVINAGLGYALGWMTFGVERFCPFGGIETLWAVATRQSFTCATGPFNLSLMLALIALTLIARKAFCSWVCPVGTISEWLGMAGRKIRRWRGSRGGKHLGFLSPTSRRDAPWRWLRLPILVLILLFTIGTGELIFRPYDPYYVLFSAHGHDVQAWSYILIGALLLAGIVLPMLWCRYLCPLGGVLWPFSRFAWLRLNRSDSACTNCGKCDAACPHGIPVSTTDSIDSGECTLCMECTNACNSHGALQLSAPGRNRSPIPAWSVIAFVILASVAGYLSAGAFSFSSYEQSYTKELPPAGRISSATFYVDGVKCVDTAEQAARQLTEIDGVLSLVAYASENRLDIQFDSRLMQTAALAEALEAPVWDPVGGEFLFGLFHVRKIQSENDR